MTNSTAPLTETDDELDDSLLDPEEDGSDYDDDPVEDEDDEMDIINDADD